MIGRLKLAQIPPEDEALRQDIRAFLADHMPDITPHERARSWLGFDAAFSRKLAKAGWLGLTLPKEFGGGGRSVFARFVVAEELLAAGAPVSAHWIADRQSGPLLLRYGTSVQKAFYLPRICSADAFFCIGMSEPGAGSDLASVQTRADRSGAGWQLNGQKLWTTNAHRSHYMIVLARTSGTRDDRQRGLSQFIVNLALPGITIRPVDDLAGDRGFSEVFFDDVELDADALIGEEGAGWQQVTAELALERSGPERIYSSIVLADAWLNHVRALGSPSEHDLVLAGRIVTNLTSLRQMSVAVTRRIADGENPDIEAALVKDLGTEFEQWVPTAIGGALASTLDAGGNEELQKTLEYSTNMAPSYSLRGGTREILRGMIAQGLGLR